MLVNSLIWLINFIIKAIGLLVGTLVSVLPASPFLLLENLQLDFLDSLNWILPLSFSVNVLIYWVGAIAVYYLVQLPLRFVKVIS